MSAWQCAPAQDEPPTTLCRWHVIRATYSDGVEPCTLHFVGRNAASWCGRVSSPVMDVDAAARRARTRSGRLYQLEGPPGIDAESVFMWRLWAEINRLSSWRDVTAEVFPEFRKAWAPAGTGERFVQ